MEKNQAIARIKELCAKRKKTQLTDEEAAELKELQNAFPKGKNKSGKGQKAGNDFSFWNNYPELLDSVTRVPWNYIPGTPISFRNNSISFKNVLRVLYTATVGICNSATDPFNLQFRDLFLQMHRKYRGLGKYQQADLAIVMVCIASAYVAIAEAERMYGVYHAYPVNNRITPRGILKALGYSDQLLDSIETHLSDFRSSINRLILKASRLVLPHEFAALQSWISLSAFLYTDSKDKRASVIAFRSSGFYKYSGTAFSTGSVAIQSSYEGYVMEATDNRARPETYQTMIDFIDDLLEALLSDDDVSIICSDLLAAFGERSLENLRPISEDYAIAPVYSESILFKLHNMEWITGDVANYFENGSVLEQSYDSMKSDFVSEHPYYAAAARAPLVICQANNVVLFNLVHVSNRGTIDDANAQYYTEVGSNKGFVVFTEPGEGVGDDHIISRDHALDTWKENPGVEDVCEGVLWKLVPQYKIWTDESNVGNAATLIKQVGTELIMSVDACSVSDGTVLNDSSVQHVTTDATDARTYYCEMSKFDWAPAVLSYNVTRQQGLPADWELTQFISDVDNFTTVDDVTIQKILDTALLSAFAMKVTSTDR